MLYSFLILYMKTFPGMAKAHGGVADVERRMCMREDLCHFLRMLKNGVERAVWI